MTSDIEPSLELAVIEEAVITMAGGRAKLRRLAQALARRPEILTDGRATGDLLANKAGATRLGFALLLKYFKQEARFPRREDVPRAAVDFMAGQVKVGAGPFADYDFTWRQAANHRGQVRDFRKSAKATDEDRLAVWLSTGICPTQTSRDRLRAALLAPLPGAAD